MPVSVQPFDLILKGGLVADGTGAPIRRADVALQGDRIAAVGDGATWRSDEVLQVDGCVVAPGFIDVHTHDDLAILQASAMEPKVSQGVTTVIVGNCGLSLAPLLPGARDPLPAPFDLLGERQAYAFETMRAYVERVRDAPASVNVGVLVGHGNLRASVMERCDRPAAHDEVARMLPLAREAFEAGALGLSSGLAYEGSRHAETAELIALAEIAAAYGGLYVTHMRDEGDRVLEALGEALDIGRSSGCPVVISHHKCLFRRNWGRTRETLAAIDAERQSHPVALDAYPYVASSTVLSPERAGDAERVLVAWSERIPDANGRDLDDLAREWDCDRRAAARRLMPGGAVYFNMDEADLRRVLAHPCCMIGSDGVPSHPHPHPRLWGTFPRVLGHYVREERLLGLQAAIHKMTGLPARVFGLRDRGVIEAGAFGDITIFDPAAVADAATFEEPTRPSVGIRRVIVNGETVFADGKAVPRPAGRLLTRAASAADSTLGPRARASHAA
jgi:N-acyl-D-amino-acid deacylase